MHKVVRQAIDTVTQFEVKARRAAFAPDTTPASTADVLTAEANATAPSKSAPAATYEKTAAAVSIESGAPTTTPAVELPRSVGAIDAQTSSATGEEPKHGAPRSAIQLDGARSLRPEQPDDPFKDVLAGASNLMREFQGPGTRRGGRQGESLMG